MEKFKTGLDIAATSTRNFTASQIPLLGGIKSLAGEFGEATKQVLLYGTAYKGLAFITSLPGQVLNAAKSQQQYNNALKTATQDTGTYGKELLYVDNIQRAFGLDLETTRTGFVRLYASMAPTGFDSGSIEKLFTGISAATAALQLTPDKAERVIYAFGQMASKGQIMSEELKGQLGDVLPGALAIFAKAAGMSVKEFSKAMEDGVFVGGRFREVFAKVSDELMNRFGTGAAAAGKSLQGLINVVGGDFKRTLESFAPLANDAAQSILGPLGGALNQLAKAAQIATGETDRLKKQISQAQKDVADLKLVPDIKPEQIQAAEKNVLALKIRQEALNEAYKDPAIKSQVEGIQNFVSELSKVGNFITNLASILQGTLGPAFSILGNNLTTVLGSLISLTVGFAAAKLAALAVMGMLNTMNAVVKAGGTISALAAAKHALLAAAFRVLGVQATGAKLATIGFGVAVKGLLASTGIGLLVVALTSAATAFMTLGDKAAEAARKAKQSIDSMAEAARTGNAPLIEMELAINKADRQDLENLIKDVQGLTGKKKNVAGGGTVEMITLTPALKREARRLGVEVGNSVSKESVIGSLSALRGPLKQAAEEGQKDLVLARERAEKLGLNKPGAVTPGAEESEEQKTKKDNLAQYNSLQDQLAKDFTQHQIELLDIEHQHKVSLMNVFYDLQEARANSHQKTAIRFQKELYNIAAEYQSAQLKAQAEVMKAQGSVAGGAPVLPPPQGSGGAFDTGMRTGPSRAIGGSADYHQDIMFGSAVSMKERVQLMDQLAQGYEKMGRTIEFSNAGVAGERYRSSMSYEAKSSLISRAQAAHANRAGGSGRAAMDFYAPMAAGNRFDKSVEGQAMLAPSVEGASYSYGGGGRSGRTMTASRNGAMIYQQLHGNMEIPLQVGAPRKITADESRDARAAQQTQLAIQKEKVAVTLKEVEAIRKMEVAMENYVASIVPVAEQDLQNRLLAQRIQLTADIASPAVLDAQIKYAEQEAMATENIRLNNEEIAKLSQAKDANGRISVETAARIETLRQANEKLKTSLPTSQVQLLTEAIGKQTLSILEQVKAKQIEAEDSKQVNRLIIEGMTRQEAEAKVAANRFRGDYAKALEIANEAIQKISAEQEIYNIKKAQNIALTKGETDEYNRLAIALEEAKKRRDELEGKASEVEGAATALETTAASKTPSEAIEDRIAKLKEEIADLTNIGNIAITVADGIGAAFGQAFQGLISGSMSAKEALSGFFKSVGDMFIQMATEIIAKQLVMITLQLILKALGAVAGGGGGGSNFSGAFKSAPATSFGDALKMPKLAANGATFANGVATFAKGGAFTNSIVSGPTMFEFANGGMMQTGLMGEAGPEAIMPLSRGAGGRLGVDASGLRESMDRQASTAPVSPVLNMSFESTSINGVEYVSRDQLEQAMAETRRAASRDGASRGMTMTLDRIQNSSSTRRRIGV
jgi:tape measure domain-containing protein